MFLHEEVGEHGTDMAADIEPKTALDVPAVLRKPELPFPAKDDIEVGAIQVIEMRDYSASRQERACLHLRRCGTGRNDQDDLIVALTLVMNVAQIEINGPGGGFIGVEEEAAAAALNLPAIIQQLIENTAADYQRGTAAHI